MQILVGHLMSSGIAEYAVSNQQFSDFKYNCNAFGLVEYEIITEDQNVQDGIWTDRGSGADENVSFWRVYPDKYYYPLGDTACKNWSRCKSMIRVKDVSPEGNILRKDGFQMYT